MGKAILLGQYLIQRPSVAGRSLRHSFSLPLLTSLFPPTFSGWILPYIPVCFQSLDPLASAYHILELQLCATTQRNMYLLVLHNQKDFSNDSVPFLPPDVAHTSVGPLATSRIVCCPDQLIFNFTGGDVFSFLVLFCFLPVTIRACVWASRFLCQVS